MENDPASTPKSVPEANGPGPSDRAELVPASTLRRVIAFVIDLGLVAAVTLITGGGSWVLLAIFAAYHAVSLAIFGCTLGKAMMALTVQRPDGGRLGWLPALLRSTVGYLASSFALLGFLNIFRDARRRTWHDVLFGSEVVQQPGALSLTHVIRAIDEWTDQLDVLVKHWMDRYDRLKRIWSLVLRLTGLMTTLHSWVEQAARWILGYIKKIAAAAAPQKASGATTTAAAGTGAAGTAASTVTAVALAAATVVTYQAVAPEVFRPGNRHEVQFLGPTPYLSQADSPFNADIISGGTFLADFEDGLLNTPGVSASAGGVTSVVFGRGLHDSVDADDGVIDGSGSNGDSFFSWSGSTGITFSFDASILGSPTHAGLVWTDGVGTTLFEAFGPDGVSLGTIGPVAIADNTHNGATAEDHFFGVINASGISSIKISNTSGGIEIDHLQYGKHKKWAQAISIGRNQVFEIDSNVLARFEFNGNVNDSSGTGRHARLLGGEFVKTPWGQGLHVSRTNETGIDWSTFANLLVPPYTIEIVLTPSATGNWGKLFSFEDANDRGWYYKDKGIQAYPHPVRGGGKVHGNEQHYLAFVSTGPRTVDVYFQGSLIGPTDASFQAPPRQAIFFRDDTRTGRQEQIDAVVEALRISNISRTPDEIAAMQRRLTSRAEKLETITVPVSVNCTSTGQLCDPPFSIRIETQGLLKAQYFVLSPYSCSSLKVHIFVDGTQKMTTDFLGWPGAAGTFAKLPLHTGLLNLGPVSPGTHTLSLRSEGQQGGCNYGALFSWGGELRVVTHKED